MVSIQGKAVSKTVSLADLSSFSFKKTVLVAGRAAVLPRGDASGSVEESAGSAEGQGISSECSKPGPSGDRPGCLAIFTVPRYHRVCLVDRVAGNQRRLSIAGWFMTEHPKVLPIVDSRKGTAIVRWLPPLSIITGGEMFVVSRNLWAVS